MGGGVEKSKYNSNGFTLAELLAVVAILGVIALIAFPAVNKIIKSSKEKAYESQKEIILSSAKNWGLDHLGELSEESDTYLTIEELKRDGYIEAKQVINPITDEEMIGCIIIHYDESYNQYVYEYSEAGCSETSKLPIITLNGNRTMSIEINGTYTELGATAKYQGEDISSSIVVSGSVDTTKVGTYYIKYNVSYNGVSAREIVRVVKVVREGGSIVDPEEPDDPNGLRLTLSPNELSEYSQVTAISVSAIPATGTTIQKLTYKLNGGVEQDVIDNQIVLDTDGEHTVEVTAIDYYGNAKTVIGHYLIDVTLPEIILSDITIGISEVENFDLMKDVSATDSLSGIDGSIETSGSLAAIAGTYEITYTVKDKAQNMATVMRRIFVVPNEIVNTVIDSEATVIDPFGNTRYVGKSPNNYVKFNNTKWRIIGIFDGQMKIMQDSFYSTSIAWDAKASSGGHGDHGWNDWSKATLQRQLNTTFWNKINSTYQGYVDQDHVWNLGSLNYGLSTRSNVYELERGNQVPGGRPITWTGKVGLMYPSDYGYSTDSTDEVCDTTTMYNDWMNGASKTECVGRSWIYDSLHKQWVLTPSLNFIDHNFYIHNWGSVASWYSDGIFDGIVSSESVNTVSARPVVYLKPSVKITEGSGTSSLPYELGL